MNTAEPGQYPDLPPLSIGAVVRVFRTAKSSPLYFHDPETGAVSGSTRDDYAVGKVRERRGDSYRVTVLRQGKEVYLDWRSRHWIRLSHEPAPHRHR